MKPMARVTAINVRAEIETTDANGKVKMRQVTKDMTFFEADLGPNLYHQVMGMVQPLLAQAEGGADAADTGDSAPQPDG